MSNTLASKATASTNAMDVTLCDYVGLTKLRTGSQKAKETMADKQLRKWRKGWVVISSKGLLNFTLEYYKDEDQWLTPSKTTKKITICELLKDIISVEHMRSSYKSHVMSIIFDNYSILISFKSRTTMESWITKLNNIKAYFLVQLITSSNDAIKPAPYLLHVQDKKLVGYNAIGAQEVAWTWNSTDFFGFRLKRKIVPEIEIVIGTESAAHGNFCFIGPALTVMCSSIREKVLTLGDESKPVKVIKKGGWLEDSRCGATNDKLKALQQPSLLQINPSYGVSPSESIVGTMEKTKTEATVHTYVNMEEAATEAAAHTYYVNDPNHNTIVVEDYEYISMSTSSTEQLIPPQNLYETHYF